MDYEKAYKEALERARMYRDNAKAVEEYAAMDGLAKGCSVQQKEQKPNIEICPHSIKSKSFGLDPAISVFKQSV